MYCVPSQFLHPQIDFKATQLILSRLLVNNPVNNPFSCFHALVFAGFMLLRKSEQPSRGFPARRYQPSQRLNPAALLLVKAF